MSPASFPHEAPVAAADVGMDRGLVERARQLFAKQCRRGRFPGGQLVVRRQGKLVVDDAVGLSRGLRPEEPRRVPVEPSTRFPVYSCSKAVLATAFAMLEERGVVDVTKPVAHWWPEFAQHGKGELTVLDVLTHRAGVFTPELMRNAERWADEAHVRAELERAAPRWPRGTLAYMPYEFGWILAEVAKRALGRPLDAFIHDELSTPLELPQLRFAVPPADVEHVARTYWVGGRAAVAGVELSDFFEGANNTAAVLCTFVPAAGVVTDAASLAGLYEMLVAGGVTRSGRRLLREETVREYTRSHVFAVDKSNRAPLCFGRGFILGVLGPSMYGWWGTRRCFGHAGAFSSLGWGDFDTGLAVAIVTNGNASSVDNFRRTASVSHLLRRACR